MFILSCKHDSDIMFIVSEFIVPWLNPVETDVGESAGAAADVNAQQAMFFTEADHVLEKSKHILVLF